MDLVRVARTRSVKTAATAAGADLVGIAPAVAPPGHAAYGRWIEHGYHGRMAYLARPEALAARADPSLLLEGARSIVCTGWSYGDPARPEPPDGGRVARYARTVDYHALLTERLEPVAAACRALGGEARIAVDSAPVCEVAHAARAGLGWIGKNTLLLAPGRGSWLLLGEVVTTLDLEPDAPQPDRCGTCTRCLDACPTAAFVAPHVLDARRCIAYLTIELREATPAKLRESMGRWLFGCDICQEVCPWNQRFGAVAGLPELRGEAAMATVEVSGLLALTADEFRRRFRETPLWRAKRAGLLRNACLVLGNLGDPAAVECLELALGDAEPLVRAHAAWALGRLGAAAPLRRRREVESDAAVLAELESALSLAVAESHRRAGRSRPRGAPVPAAVPGCAGAVSSADGLRS